MIEEDNGSDDGKSEHSVSENVCNFFNSSKLINDLMLQSDAGKQKLISTCIPDKNLTVNRKQIENVEELMGPWSQKSFLNLWPTNYFKKFSKCVQDEMDTIKKKKRAKEAQDRLDLSLDYTACVNSETFEYQPNSYFYIKFKNMIRNVSTQNKKIRRNGFSQNIKEKLKTRAAVVSECLEDKPEGKLSYHSVIDECEDSTVSSQGHLACQASSSQATSKSNSGKKTNSLASSSAPPMKNGRVSEVSVERLKSNSVVSSPGTSDAKQASERMFSRFSRTRSNLMTRAAFPYVVVEQTLDLQSKGVNKSSPSIPSKCSVLNNSSNPISCFGKSLSISNVLPPIGQKMQSCKFSSTRKK